MLKKFMATSGAALLIAAGLGVGMVQASAAPAKVKAIGVCVKANGSWRVMEPTRLNRSQYGRCKKGERELTLPTVPGVPKEAAVIVYKRATGVETCTRTAAATYSCVTVSTPTPTPTPTLTPVPSSTPTSTP